MQGSRIDNFLDEVLIHIKSPFDKDEIREELSDHINDMIEDYQEQGYSFEESKQKCIENMGDPKEIGVLLNEEHKPWIGWLFYVSNMVRIILIMFVVLFYGASFLSSFATRNTPRNVDQSKVIYHIKIKEKIDIGDKVIHLTDVIYDVEGDLTLFYKGYNTSFFGGLGSSYYLRNYSDDLGNNQFGHSGAMTGGFIDIGYVTLIGFDINAKYVVIEYDQYNRYFKVEIPLPGGYDE